MATRAEGLNRSKYLHFPGSKTASVRALVSAAALSIVLISTALFVMASNGEEVGATQRALDAWAARYQGQAEAYVAGVSQNPAEAWFARTNAYNTQRALEAWAARYQAQAEAFEAGLTQNPAGAWFARTNAYNTQRALEAWAARYTGLAAEHLGGK